MQNELMIGFLGRPVLVRTKHDLFGAVISGQWHDAKSALAGPVVRNTSGNDIAVDWKRIVRFTDTDEIPFEGEFDD
jgi:hypothetical protein